MRRLTTTDLINDVRSMIDEDNTSNVTDDSDIIPALNRAQDVAADILSRHYESPLLKEETLALISGQQDYAMPEDAFEERVEKVDINLPGRLVNEVKRISYRDASPFQSTAQVSIPYYYSIINNKIRFYPVPTGTYTALITYLVDPLPLVKEQGRVTVLNPVGNYIIVDEVGTDLTTIMSDLNSYVNIVDGETGKVKSSLQIQSINGQKITFKTVPTRDEVLGQSILDNIDDVELDDYVCVVSGTCIPILKKPFSNFITEYAAADMRNKLEEQMKMREELTKQVERTWAGREQTLRVKKRSNQWGYFTRRYWSTS